VHNLCIQVYFTCVVNYIEKKGSPGALVRAVSLTRSRVEVASLHLRPFHYVVHLT
jgi:hypothetical protein